MVKRISIVPTLGQSIQVEGIQLTFLKGVVRYSAPGTSPHPPAKLICCPDKAVPVMVPLFHQPSVQWAHVHDEHYQVVLQIEDLDVKKEKTRFTDETLASEARANCKFYFEDSTWPLFVNREVLSVHSKVFRTMFESDFKEKNAEEVSIKTLKREEFLAFLECLYGPSRQLSHGNVKTVYTIADRYDCHELMAECRRFLEKNEPVLVEEYKDFVELAERHKLAAVLEKTLEKVRAPVLAAMQHDDWLQTLNAETREAIFAVVRKKLCE